MSAKQKQAITTINPQHIALQSAPPSNLSTCDHKIESHEHSINSEILANLTDTHKQDIKCHTLSEQERIEGIKALGLEALSEQDLSAPLQCPSKFKAKSDEEIAALVLSTLIFGQKLSFLEALYCYETLDLEILVELAHSVTKEIAGNYASLCSITNVKSGACSQDCKWCAQSRHYHTQAEVYGIKDEKQCLHEAKLSYEQGIEMFSFVASGRKPNKKELAQLTALSDHIHQHLPIKMCASLGLLDEEQLKTIKEHHITRYHCNLESAPSFFHHVVKSHTIIDKLKTIRLAQKIGIQMCSGGILGMGESPRQRVELAWTLSQLNIQSIPINFLHPIKGTPLEHMPLLSDEEILRSIAIFRLLNPKAHLRFAGGRILLSESMVNKAIYAGINAAIVGDLLTTIGSDVAQDRARFKEHDYTLPPIPQA